MLYGYLLSSFIYFQMYAHTKIYLKELLFGSSSTADEFTNHNTNQHSMLATASVSFIASAFAEITALGFYYPYDLIKTRMQANNEIYGYKGCLDAAIKMYEEGPSKYARGSLMDRVSRMSNLYKGMLFYSAGYVSFVAFEFSIFETVLQYLEEFLDRGRGSAYILDN